mmetsp:Transcript_19522/g.46629  ORF Transcript_19522/g.46629 Transcript_19522/m.46629 type:complete len:177 (-) Transcript_19522:124-654(-)
MFSCFCLNKKKHKGQLESETVYRRKPWGTQGAKVLQSSVGGQAAEFCKASISSVGSARHRSDEYFDAQEDFPCDLSSAGSWELQDRGGCAPWPGAETADQADGQLPAPAAAEAPPPQQPVPAPGSPDQQVSPALPKLLRRWEPRDAREEPASMRGSFRISRRSADTVLCPAPPISP